MFEGGGGVEAVERCPVVVNMFRYCAVDNFVAADSFFFCVVVIVCIFFCSLYLFERHVSVRYVVSVLCVSFSVHCYS